MAEKSFPFNSIKKDRRYKAEEFAGYFAQLIGTGVVYTTAESLKLQAAGGMELLLSVGGAFIKGRAYINDTEKRFVLETADGVLSRIDRLVIRCDYAERMIGAKIKKGIYTEEPEPQALQRDADAYEIAIADIWIGGGVISVSQADITDLRLNTELCGIVTGLIQQADTTNIFNQFTMFLSEFKQGHVTEFGNWEEKQKQEFIIWENGIKDILDENTAGNLLRMIGELENLATTEKGNLVEAINENFQLGSEKKQKLVENLTAMGVPASTEETWEELLNKVLDMTDTSKDTVTKNVLLEKYTAHNAAGKLITGTMPERASMTVDTTGVTQDSSYTYFGVPEGHYDENSKVRAINSDLSSGIYYIGTGTNFDLKSKFPDDYSKFTTDNFIVVPTVNAGTSGNQGQYTGGYGQTYYASNTKLSLTKTYTNGVISISASLKITASATSRSYDVDYPRSKDYSPSISCAVYLVVGEIKNL